MKRAELVAGMAVSCAMIVVALVLLFGVYALLGSGVMLLTVMLFADPLDYRKHPKGRE